MYLPLTNNTFRKARVSGIPKTWLGIFPSFFLQIFWDHSQTLLRCINESKACKDPSLAETTDLGSSFRSSFRVYRYKYRRHILACYQILLSLLLWEIAFTGPKTVSQNRWIPYLYLSWNDFFLLENPKALSSTLKYLKYWGVCTQRSLSQTLGHGRMNNLDSCSDEVFRQLSSLDRNQGITYN